MSWCMVHLYIPTFVWFLMVSAGEYTIHGCYVTRFSDLMWLNDDTGDGHGILRLFVNDVYCLLCNQHLMYVGPFFFVSCSECSASLSPPKKMSQPTISGSGATSAGGAVFGHDNVGRLGWVWAASRPLETPARGTKKGWRNIGVGVVG